MILAIDFDHTICDTDKPPKGFKMGPPMQGAKDALIEYKRQGHTIIIHTAQTTHDHIKDWMNYFQIPYDQITNIKPLADLYIDDKAYHFTTWSNVHIENWA